ncbi:MAG: hypothetical protein KGO50_08425, partial [Myxococcales bacterium]|nr:hypothetical protein [Myxococcales bacterium]
MEGSELLLMEPIERLHEVGRTAVFRCLEGACESAEEYIFSNGPVDAASAHYYPDWAFANDVNDPEAAEHILGQTRRWLETQPPDALVEVTVQLREQPFDFSQFGGGLSDRERATVFELRQSQIRPAQDEFIAALERIDAEVVGRGMILSIVDVRLPASAVMGLMELPHTLYVVGVHEVRSDQLDGSERETAMGAQNSVPQGESGGLNGGPIRVAVIEVDNDTISPVNTLNSSHVGWLDYPGGPSRIRETDFCSYNAFGNVVCNNTASGTASTHGTSVASILMGSIEQGQDSLYPGANTAAQNARSGLAREAELHYYRCEDNSNRVRVALQGNRVLRGLHRDARQHTQQIVAVPPRLLPLVGDPKLARGLDLQQIGG